ncbi:MAG: CDP-alcohol phosphatidyltransferase family protein [Deltaproteobacteria bacterium]|nr:CDP-alcohol phosphatidyltransferase family protein [Deltaproteobacteria bacterium]
MNVSSRNSLTLPNIITIIRILLTPLFIILLIQGRYGQALLVFLLAGLSDLVDGLIARTWQQKTPLGTFLDPLADKLLLSSSFVALSVFRLMPAWLTVVVISRDMTLVLGIILLKLTDMPVIIKPSRAGKWTAALQVMTVLLVLVGTLWPLNANFLTAWFWLVGGVTALSGIQYVYRELKRVGRTPAD